ncbi:type III restriction endonuclease subunit R [Deinococcus sp. SDU3-2]|uniref:Type III restriction endonuclease subunit R n=1 Tax=Deinococcus terrestris TaxID=2651870 RepID=A0A7X1TT54_9DEIO|nr:DEAD/DEAH box helicase family protein [Deinococcus terrestris]MPY68067.1 type III restriction endonuclease subunit R [Deinococcus terrestris]
MRYTLHDYQDDAVRRVLKNLAKARKNYQWDGSLSQFSLTATTGAGKTVMAAAVIEALFFGADEYNLPADPGAVVLWFSDDPSLNEQSRIRLQAAASELDSRLRVIEADFGEPKFRPGHVYFLNTQKLSKNSRLVRGEAVQEEGGFLLRPDNLQSSIYDTIRNTIEDEHLTLYMVLDEAHRGMGRDRNDNERSTIVQRLINGKNRTPAIPIVWGISATVKRFEDAMKGATERMALPSVLVNSELVQASGLLKDDIVLSIPTTEGKYDLTLLGRAVDKIKASTQAWAEYAHEQRIDPVVPLLVVQVADRAKGQELQELEELNAIVQTIHAQWPDLPPGAIANVFGEHKDLTLMGELVPYIAPERVQDTTRVRVLLAKSAISTGWDCPRAEVLVSFRPAQDQTHITQLLGRMMRTPLAQRIPGNELLNSVDCLLPFFDRQTAKAVAAMLIKGDTSQGEDDTGANQDRRVLFDPVTLHPNAAVDPEVWTLFERLPTLTLPRKDVKPIRRLTALAAALSRDHLVEGAVEQAFAHLHGVLDEKSRKYSQKLDQARENVRTMRGEEVRGRMGGTVTVTRSFSESADPRAILASFQAAGRLLSIPLSKSYAEHLAGEGAQDDDLLEAYIDVAAAGQVPDLVRYVEWAADRLARQWLAETREARRGLSDVRKAEYDRLERQSTQPERRNLVAPVAAQAESRERLPNGTEQDLATYLMHLMATDAGAFPADLNEWEKKVLEQEMGREGFVGWYRNPSRALQESLAIPYTDPASGDWRAMRPDFVFFSREPGGTLVADLIDPHGHHLADALPKLRGLADFAETYGGEFRRIQSVAEVSGQFWMLDMKQPEVRAAVRGAVDAKALYLSALATSY